MVASSRTLLSDHVLLGTTDHRERTFSVEVVKHLVFLCTEGSDVIEAVQMEGYGGKSM